MEIFASPSWDVDAAGEDLNRQLFGPSVRNEGKAKKKKTHSNSNNNPPTIRDASSAKQALLTELKSKLASKRKLPESNDSKTLAPLSEVKKKKRVHFNIEEPGVSNNDVDSNKQEPKQSKKKKDLKKKDKNVSSLTSFLSRISKKKAESEKNKTSNGAFDDADNSKLIADKQLPKMKKKNNNLVLSVPEHQLLNSSVTKKSSPNGQASKVDANSLDSVKTKKKKKSLEDSTSHLDKKPTNMEKPLAVVSKKSYRKTVEENQEQITKTSMNTFNRAELILPSRRKPGTLRERMMRKLQASRFRYLNEQMYCSKGSEALDYFKTDPEAFKAYHEGYRQQVTMWPLNPLDKIISALKKKSSDLVIADFGCGDAKLAHSLPNIVHSFDLVAVSKDVTACDMAHTPLGNASVDVAVFCLSLMGTNLEDYLKEAYRVLKVGGVLKVAEVESRFENIDTFIKSLQNYGFEMINKDLSQNLFYFMDFKKGGKIKISGKKKVPLPPVTLKPCLYKKR